jgi:hypothetical protein
MASPPAAGPYATPGALGQSLLMPSVPLSPMLEFHSPLIPHAQLPLPTLPLAKPAAAPAVHVHTPDARQAAPLRPHPKSAPPKVQAAKAAPAAAPVESAAAASDGDSDAQAKRHQVKKACVHCRKGLSFSPLCA